MAYSISSSVSSDTIVAERKQELQSGNRTDGIVSPASDQRVLTEGVVKGRIDEVGSTVVIYKTAEGDRLILKNKPPV
ncbi:uncharacterized protein LOC126579116, partial [Anopheles aquasalis]|uniref:uncharacterized protein LOC126579116 n=1 Tax=Anopheles aquasalis TaxID=42839 RepID=UPI00215B2EF6